ncbi:uracil phosphoribosyltransferase-like protein [Elsinoe australis]|uniref:Uracil phosphoribosyltransferase-like protein n=1 Tax=Elsinoe australis TaxID=40998 RepID=A0A4U7AQZ9_9PEZI|nr:uracil phosphoribosyltransferase-like protein [Elsinoe australis]
MSLQHYTKTNAARILMTPTLILEAAGIHLRTAHQSIGRHLVVIFVANILGLEAFGLNEVFLLAGFLHAKVPEDITFHHVADCFNIILVDSVINTGGSIVDFVRHIRKLHATLRIVVGAGVVQSDAVKPGGMLHPLQDRVGVHIVALRASENKFKGRGTVDTGNRLFNTTKLD